MPFRQFGPLEIGLIVLIILIFFGVGKLPQVGSAIGKGIRAFRRGQSGADDSEDEDEEGTEPTSKKKASKKAASKKST